MEPFKLGIIENLYAVRFGSVWSGSVNITGPVRFGKFGIYLVRSTTVLSFDIETLNKLCDALGVQRFTAKELEYLKEFKDVLAPLAVAIDRLQGTFFNKFIIYTRILL